MRESHAAEDLVDGQVEHGKHHHESWEAARNEVWRHGRTPAAEPVFVGVTNGRPLRLIYDVEVHFDTTAAPGQPQLAADHRERRRPVTAGAPGGDRTGLVRRLA